MTTKRTLFLLFFLGFALPLSAYIGPGAGFAFLSSFLVLFLTFFLAVFSFLSWPFRFLLRLIKGQKAYKKSHINRLVVLGLDGMDPVLVDKYMARGKLPHLAKLLEEGSYHKLETTIPSISPVAWSSFMTGCHPAKHNIFDFLSRDPKTYLPDLSSAHRKSQKSPSPGQIQYSTLQTSDQGHAEKHPFLENPWGQRNLQYNSKDSGDLSPRKVPRESSLWDVRSRPEGKPGDFLLLHF